MVEAQEDQPVVLVTGSKQPFPVLPAFPVVEVLLKYTGYRQKCKRMLNLISKTGQLYVQNHGHSLESFLKVAPPMKLPFLTLRESQAQATARKALAAVKAEGEEQKEADGTESSA